MLSPLTSESPNAIDAGDAPPARPESRRLEESSSFSQPKSRASRLIEASALSSFSIDPVALSRFTSIELWDAQDRTDEENPEKKPETSPTIDEARGYAQRILEKFGQSTRDLSPESAERAKSTPAKDDSFRIKKKQYSASPEWFSFRTRLLIFLLVVLLLALVFAVQLLVRPDARIVAATPPAPISEITEPTNAPAGPAIPDGPRLVDVISFLGQFSSKSSLNDVTSPQNQAATWIAIEDPMKLPIPESSNDPGFRKFIQRYSLAVLFHSLNGAEWRNLAKIFLRGTDACEWHKTIKYENETIKLGVTCDKTGEVTALLLPANNMFGSLPAELSQFASLGLLKMSDNRIQGSIPDELRSLSLLQLVDLRHNQLTGSIPDWVGDAWKQLGEFALSFNNMTGSLPDSIAKMSDLITLAIAHNDFTNSLDPIMGLSTLNYLYLEDNKFEAKVDATFLSNMEHLVQVDISSNHLSGGDFPLHLLDHPTLKVLDLCNNLIDGPLPSLSTGNLVLEFLSLCDNGITGSLPKTFVRLSNLQHLDLTGNALNGTMPSSLMELQNMTYLFLGDNDFAPGRVPEFLSGMDRLRELSLASTHRTGTIPTSWLDDLKNMVLLDFSRNDLVGSIPTQLWGLPSLEYLMLNRNQLDGAIPPGLEATNIQALLLDKNNVTGDLTDTCNALPNITIYADCSSTSSTEILCSCCQCCADDNEDCNSELWDYHTGFAWEQNYTRVDYAFSPHLLPRIHRTSGDGAGKSSSALKEEAEARMRNPKSG